ncbi:hypothetical protein GUJ93_ZPchr0015g6796 [Zizania palustris]|uniref:Uncharacterized protein n=1 Tax=Zizania palustris TaxID=103762 RepID=A0A8J5TAZ6_ZIZPA|nr:hypothetical protein GUJ93_ZPchr0015g6796 [Zizania palustris]
MANTVPCGGLVSWSTCHASSTDFHRWRDEWRGNIFNQPSKLYCEWLHRGFDDGALEEDNLDAPTESQSGQLILYEPMSATTNLGTDAPTLTKWANKRRVKTPACKRRALDVTMH